MNVRRQTNLQNARIAPILRPIDQTDSVTKALGKLAEFVGRNGMAVGDRIPTERELSDSLGVGRSTVREVMRQWQALGIVKVHRGSGTYLRRRVSEDSICLPLVLEGKRASLLQMLEARRGIETQAATLAAVRADADGIADIEARLDAMEAVFTRDGCAGPEDLAFHLAIYDACGNPVLGQLLSQMRESLDTLFSMSDVSESLQSFAARSFPFHRDLFDAIRAGDEAGARDCTGAILDIVEEDVTRMLP